MKTEDIKKVGVVGVGQMGSGIAQVAAMAGYNVLMHDSSSEALEKARTNIKTSLQKFVGKGKLDPRGVEEIMGRIGVTQNLKDFSAVQLVIEAVTENENLKKKIFSELDQNCPPDTIFASNTSTIPIGRLAFGIKRPGKVIGMHFMNPVPLMNLVEVIRGFHTTDETNQIVREVAEKLGKVVVQSRDFPGFIVNRVLMPMINEAAYALHEGIASAEEIDTAMRLGTNQPMGPLALADLIGLDTCLYIMEVICEGLGDSKYRPCPLLKQYVEAGLLGRKTGRGFHAYEKK